MLEGNSYTTVELKRPDIDYELGIKYMRRGMKGPEDGKMSVDRPSIKSEVNMSRSACYWPKAKAYILS